MSLLTRIGVRASAGLSRTRLGEATVVHDADGVTAEAEALARSLPADPDHVLVVADLPPVSPLEVWKAFAAALPRGRRPMRIVPGRLPREIAPHVWQWLADRTGRTVVAPYGTALHLGNTLFVHSVDQSGWVEFERDKGPVWKGKRFPRPAWDSVEFGRVRAAGFRGVGEPLTAGMWLRPDVGGDALTTGRARLRTLPGLPGAPLVVVGARDVTDLELADVAAFCRTLPVAPRFVHYGGVALPGTALGQDLADALGVEVFCYNGIPTGADEVLTLRQDGSLGWNTFAQAFTYRPGGGTRLAAYRPPVDGLSEVSPGVYWYAEDVVVEVVRAGLWIRPAEQIADPAGVRATPLDPANTLLLYEATEPARADHLREVAEGLVSRLDDATRVTTRLMPSTALSGAALAGFARAGDPPAPPAEPAPAQDAGPALSQESEPTSVLTPEPTSVLTPEPTSVLTPAPAPVLTPDPVPVLTPEPTSVLTPEPAPVREPDPVPVEEPAGSGTPDDDLDDLDETDLPWLSRLMETMSMPVPARPSEVESRDDRGNR
jgi:hypothetical protein